MSNLMDYMDWRGDVTLAGSPFNEVDNLILALITMLDLSVIVPSELSSPPLGFTEVMYKYKQDSSKRDYLGVLIPAGIVDIAHMAVKCVRYRDIKCVGFINLVDEVEQMQFAALTFILPDGTIYVAFRGTDDSIVGWKEDFKLSFKTPIPAHKRASGYLENVAAHYGGGIRVGGYSKGGNLAMWAAAHTSPEVQERILKVYNNDGPGFLPENLKEPSYLAIVDRIITFIPQSSIVGAILEQGSVSRIIRSTETAIMQHDPLSWEVRGAHFVYLKQRSKFGKSSGEAFKNWVYSMSTNEREQFAELIFSVIDSTGARTLTELNEAKIKNFNIIMKSLRRLDKASRKMMMRIIFRPHSKGKAEVENKTKKELTKGTATLRLNMRQTRK